MKTLSTKNQQIISFKELKIKESTSKNRLFDTMVIQGFVENEIVGYVKYNYIPEDKSQKLQTPFDFFIYKMYADNDAIIDAYENKDHLFLLDKLALRDLQLTTEKLNTLSKDEVSFLFNSFQEKVNQTYQNQFKSFIDYWVGKPNIELIRVLSDKDDSYTDHSKPNQPLISREPKNWQGKGFGLALYTKTIDWCKNNGFELWASTNRTEDGKRMWKVLEKHPKFSVIMTHVHKYSNDGNILSSTERPKVKFS